MSIDLTTTILNESVQNEIQRLRNDGKSDEEILSILNQETLTNALNTLIDRMASDTVSTIENSMFERVMEERARTDAFVAHNEQIWYKGFAASEAMYLVSLDAARDYCKALNDFPEETRKEKQCRFTALQQIHGRACQEYLEILHLIKFGFADGAYASWRSLYELSVIAEFVFSHDESVAKAYFDQSNTDEQWHDWAKAAPEFAGHKGHIRFSDLQNKCPFATAAWKSEFKLSCQLVHPSPQGTFFRLGDKSAGKENYVPVGHSDCGLAIPAVNSAISFSVVSAHFFNLFTTGDGCVYIKTLTGWAELIRKTYLEIEKNSFPQD